MAPRRRIVKVRVLNAAVDPLPTIMLLGNGIMEYDAPWLPAVRAGQAPASGSYQPDGDKGARNASHQTQYPTFSGNTKLPFPIPLGCVAGGKLFTHRAWPQDALLTVDTSKKTLNITPAYYVFRHLSQFVVPGLHARGRQSSPAPPWRHRRSLEHRRQVASLLREATSPLGDHAVYSLTVAQPLAGILNCTFWPPIETT